MKINWSLESWIKSFRSAGQTWVMLFISLMAAIGFLFGIMNMIMWFIENTGEIPQFLIWILIGFDVMIKAGIFILCTKWILIFAKWIKERR